jgi:hypothetical protein
MSSFDTTVMNTYLVSAFSLAAIALVLSIAVVATEVVRHRPRPTVGPHRAARPAPSRVPCATTRQG